jgi:hypothetical protein
MLTCSGIGDAYQPAYGDNSLRAEREMSEMLSQPNQVWLSDASGQQYTSEVRIVAVGKSGTSSD